MNTFLLVDKVFPTLLYFSLEKQKFTLNSPEDEKSFLQLQFSSKTDEVVTYNIYLIQVEDKVKYETFYGQFSPSRPLTMDEEFVDVIKQSLIAKNLMCKIMSEYLLTESRPKTPKNSEFLIEI